MYGPKLTSVGRSETTSCAFGGIRTRMPSTSRRPGCSRIIQSVPVTRRYQIVEILSTSQLPCQADCEPAPLPLRRNSPVNAHSSPLPPSCQSGKDKNTRIAMFFIIYDDATSCSSSSSSSDPTAVSSFQSSSGQTSSSKILSCSLPKSSKRSLSIWEW